MGAAWPDHCAVVKLLSLEKIVTSRALSEGFSLSANVHRNYFWSCGISFSHAEERGHTPGAAFNSFVEINTIVLEGDVFDNEMN